MPSNATRRPDPTSAPRPAVVSTTAMTSASGPPTHPSQHHNHHHQHPGHPHPGHPGHGHYWNENPTVRNLTNANAANRNADVRGDVRHTRQIRDPGPPTIQETSAPNRPRRELKPTDPVPPPPPSSPPPTTTSHPRPAPPVPHGDDQSPTSPGHSANTGASSSTLLNPELLPDILNAHLPPPYSTLPHNTEHSHRRSVMGLVPPPPPPPPPPPMMTAVPPLATPRRLRLGSERFPPVPRDPARRNRPRSSPRGSHYTPEDEPKHCCGVTVTQTVSIRWFIVMIAFVGLCCAVVGTVLGALKATGREHLTVSLLMIGVGIVLITVSGIAWRLTSHDAPSCRMMLGLHSEEPEPNRRFVPRVPPSYGRPHHPFAAMMYPEFQYRPPPPSYQASMQEYRLRLLLLDRHHPAPSTSLSPVSPPPTYRSNAGTNTFARPPINFSRENEYSRPPSYRSRASSVNPCPNSEVNQNSNGGTISGVPAGGTLLGGVHSRDPSLSLSLLSHESLFDVASPTQGSDQRSGSSGPQSPPGLTLTSTSTSSSLAARPSSAVIDTRHMSPPNVEVRIPASRHDAGHTILELPPSVDHHHHSVHHRSPSAPKIMAADVIPSSKSKRLRDCNVVTIVQTNNSSRVLPGDPSRVDSEADPTCSSGAPVQRSSTHSEMEVLAHL